MAKLIFPKIRPLLAAAPASRQTGISLVEIMVTLAIIGVATSLVLLTIPTRPLFKQETTRLQETLEQTADRSRITGQPMGLVIEGQTYSPAIWQNGSWRLLASYTLSADIRIQIDGAPPAPPEDDAPLVPAIIFDPLGHTQPVTLDLIRNRAGTRLTLRPDGTVGMEAL